MDQILHEQRSQTFRKKPAQIKRERERDGDKKRERERFKVTDGAEEEAINNGGSKRSTWIQFDVASLMKTYVADGQ